MIKSFYVKISRNDKRENNERRVANKIMGRVLLVNESIFTEEMKIIVNSINMSITTITKIKEGVELKEYDQAIHNLRVTCGILENLIDKKFMEARVRTRLIEKHSNNNIQE